MIYYGVCKWINAEPDDMKWFDDREDAVRFAATLSDTEEIPVHLYEAPLIRSASISSKRTITETLTGE
jgi:hypothetical protein